GVLGVAQFSARKEVLTAPELHLVVVLGVRIRADQLLHGFHGVISAAQFLVCPCHLIENLIAVLVTGILGEQPLINCDCLRGTFGSSITTWRPQKGIVGVGAREEWVFSGCAPLEFLIGFRKLTGGSCGGRIGSISRGAGRRLTGHRGGHFPRLAVTRVYA